MPTPTTVVDDAILLHRPEMIDAVLEEMEDDDAKQELAKIRARAEIEQRRCAKHREELQTLQSMAAAGPNVSNASSSRAPMPISGNVGPLCNGYSVQQAQQWAPPDSRLRLEQKWHFRWRIEADYLCGMRSKSFGTEPGQPSGYQAMVWCLNIAW